MGPGPATNVVEGMSRGSAINKLTKMVRDLQIEQASRESGGPQINIPRPRKDGCGATILTTYEGSVKTSKRL